MTVADAPVAIVTGASAGIGAACARGLAEDGFSLVLVGRTTASLEEVRSELAGQAIAVAADLADPRASAAIVGAASGAFGRVDALVNNAAIILREPVDAVTVDAFDAQVAVNVRGPLLLVGAAMPLLRTSPQASIVNISSTAGTLNRRGQCVYAMTKAAINHLTRTMAAELAPDRVRVNAVSPGPVDTPSQRGRASSWAELETLMLQQIPLGRVGAPEDIALWVRYLCRPSANWVTGAILSVDGGQGIDYK